MQYPAISHYHYCVKTSTNTNTTSNVTIITYLINVQLRNLAQAGYTCRLTDWDGPASILEERHRMESSTAVYSLQIMIILSLQISSGIGMKLVLSFGDPEEGLFTDTEIQPQPENQREWWFLLVYLLATTNPGQGHLIQDDDPGKCL